jgi:hypothetical protein
MLRRTSRTPNQFARLGAGAPKARRRPGAPKPHSAPAGRARGALATPGAPPAGPPIAVARAHGYAREILRFLARIHAYVKATAITLGQNTRGSVHASPSMCQEDSG